MKGGTDVRIKTGTLSHFPAGSPSLGQEGIKEGEQMLDFLAKHPSTATFIATKMLKWLLTPSPTQTQIAAVASAYRATGGDIKAMVRAILNETWLPASPMKLKRPSHFLVSAMRSTNATIASATVLSNSLTTLGQQLFNGWLLVLITRLLHHRFVNFRIEWRARPDRRVRCGQFCGRSQKDFLPSHNLPPVQCR